MTHLRTTTTLSTQKDPTHKHHPHINGIYASHVRVRKYYNELKSTSGECKYNKAAGSSFMIYYHVVDVQQEK
jgi:hypothetical protein